MRACLMLGVAAAAFAGGKAAADEAPGSPPASSSAFNESPEAAAPDDLGDVITVFATRNESRAFEYPGAVSVLERDVIDDFNLSTVSELFAAIPGAQFDSGARRTGDAPAVRGLSGAGVQVFFDGARQSFLSGHDGRFFIDPELLKSVEVVRGPTSALYGSGALGGVIAFRTITAGDLLDEGEQTAIRLGGGYQSVNEEWRATATGAWRNANDTFDVVGSLTRRESGDIELGNGLDLPADDEILSSLVKASVRPVTGLEAALTWQRYGGESVDPNNPQGTNVAEPGNGLVDRDILSETVQGRVSFRPNGTSNLVDFNLTAFTSGNEVEEAEVDTPRVVTREVETFGVAFDNRSRVSVGDKFSAVFTYGAEYYVDEQTGRDTDTVDGTRGGVPDAETRFTGVFAQAEVTLNRPLGAPGVLTIIPGARWDRFENEAVGEPSTDDDAFAPKVGVSYQPVPQLLLFANWAEAFRAPSFNELYADGIHFQLPDPASPPGPPQFVSNVFVSNLDLEPERSETIEFGAGVDFAGAFSSNDRFTAKASYYIADVDNLINLEVAIPAGCFGAPFPPCGSGEPFGNTSRNVNVTNAEIEGFELEASYDSDLFYARANFSTIDGEDKDTGDFVANLQPDTGFIDAGLKLDRIATRVGGRVTAASEFDETDDPNQFRDGYAKGDVYVVWAPLSGPLEGLRVDLGVDNVTDADFEVVAAGASQPGRNYKAAVRWGATF